MKKILKSRYFLICFTLAVCGFLQWDITVKADSVITAQPESSVTEEAITAQPATEQPSTDEMDADGNVKNGWNSDRTSYYKDGSKVTGVNEIDGELYYFTSKGSLYTKKGLREIGDKTYYFTKSHTLKTGVVKVDGKYYYFQKKNGERYEASGVKKIDGQYYCFTSQYTLKSGWYRNDKNKRYYFDKNTYAALTGWNYVGKYKYYFNKKGQLQQDVRKILGKQSSYMIKVNRTACCTTVYAKDGKKGYTIPVVSFVCSTGEDTPTGTYRTGVKHRWHELFGPCWGQWCTQITGNILFHSVYYNEYNNNKTLDVSAYNKLGKMVSHGCVRLRAGDAKWIYDNCKEKTQVIIYNNKKNPGPFDKPTAQKLDANHTWDPTDPAFK